MKIYAILMKDQKGFTDIHGEGFVTYKEAEECIQQMEKQDSINNDVYIYSIYPVEVKK
jgi:hypothetical protein